MNLKTLLVLIARRTAIELEHFYGRRDRLPILYLGIDHEVFNPDRCSALRSDARKTLDLAPGFVYILLVGNDWMNKGLPVLLEALALLKDLSVGLLVVGRDDPASYHEMVHSHELESRVKFLPPRSDVQFYYAVADIFAGTSLEDTFALPSEEAMACGLPVIVSSTNGTSEIITNGENGMILQDPTDAKTLAGMIRHLYSDRDFRERLGTNAAATARQYTWERNGRELGEIFEEILRRKTNPAPQSLAQEL